MQIASRNVWLADICQWFDTAGLPQNLHHFSAEIFVAIALECIGTKWSKMTQFLFRILKNP
jgi:hypothetical protein